MTSTAAPEPMTPSSTTPTVAELAAPPPRPGRKPILQSPLLWALPAVAVTLAFHYISVGIGAGYAFTDWNGLGAAADWVGLDNFKEILTDTQARGALIHTLVIAFCFVVVANVLGMALAIGCHRQLKSRYFLRAAFFAPVVLSSLAVSYIWKFIFDFEGPLNLFLGKIGLESWQQSWTGSPTFALWTVFVVLVWQFSGQSMIIYIAGLEGVPEEIIDSASIDGASAWSIFRRIKLPLLAPSITISSTLSLLMGLRVFDQVMALTGGGPVGASETLATQVYKQAFVSGRFGYSAATALVLTALVLVISLAQLALLRGRERSMG